MITAIISAFCVIAGMGLVLGLGLAVADKKLAVVKDEKLVVLEDSMPGANCGGCGFAGCSAYAEAVYKGEAEVGLCAPGGAALAARMGEVMGVSVDMPGEKMVAFVHCRGNEAVTGIDFKYEGMMDCNAAYLLQAGPNACKEGCLHLGSCMKVCPAQAIYKDSEGFIKVDSSKCIGCKKCTTVCPTGAIKMIPASAQYVVACNNHESGAKVRKECMVGCIGCKICEVKVPSSGCKVTSFLSAIDYAADHSNIAQAAELCPQKCIVKKD